MYLLTYQYIPPRCKIAEKAYHLHNKRERSGCSLGIGERRMLRLLHRILRLNFACFLTGLCPSIITLLLLSSILLFLQFLMKPPTLCYTLFFKTGLVIFWNPAPHSYIYSTYLLCNLPTYLNMCIIYLYC